MVGKKILVGFYKLDNIYNNYKKQQKDLKEKTLKI
jgi:hypothetical protein